MYALFLIHFVATYFMTGLIWFVQVVHYPLFALITQDVFIRYETRNVFLTTLVVGLPMLVELITAWMLLWKKPSHIAQRLLWINCTLLVIIWLTSFCVQVPLHMHLMQGFDSTTQQYLFCSNWIRTILWSIRALLLTMIVYKLLNRISHKHP